MKVIQKFSDDLVVFLFGLVKNIMSLKMIKKYKFQIINQQVEVAWIFKKGKFSRVLGFNMAKRLFDAVTKGEHQVVEMSDGIDDYLFITTKD